MLRSAIALPPFPRTPLTHDHPPLQEPSASGRSADRPKADLYFASYSLPGAASTHTTAARMLTAASVKGPVAPAALSARAWSAKLGHTKTFQVRVLDT